MQIDNLFSLPLATISLPDDILANSLSIAEKYIQDNDWRNKRHYGGTVTSYHDDSKRNYIGYVDMELGQFINESFREYLHLQGFDPNADLRIESWLNLNPPDTHHSTHEHYGCFMGGVTWLKVPKDSGDFALHDPVGPRVQNTVQYTFAKKEITRYNTEIYTVYPEPGKMIMFPSWAPHQVLPNKSNDNRISIAFNAWMIK